MSPCNRTPRLRPARCRAYLRKKFPQVADAVEEYIGEAEHQDGTAYWGNFATYDDVEQDFRLYLDCLEEST